jgi:hypothetical protein
MKKLRKPVTTITYSIPPASKPTVEETVEETSTISPWKKMISPMTLLNVKARKIQTFPTGTLYSTCYTQSHGTVYLINGKLFTQI